MKAMLRRVDDHGVIYEALMFVCPGCQTPQMLSDGSTYTPTGVHVLAVNSTTKQPQWTWDGNLEAPTLSPSILSRTAPFVDGAPQGVCHSYLKAGVFEFLSDCTHEFAGQHVPMPDLPEWATDDKDGR